MNIEISHRRARFVHSGLVLSGLMLSSCLEPLSDYLKGRAENTNCKRAAKQLSLARSADVANLLMLAGPESERTAFEETDTECRPK